LGETVKLHKLRNVHGQVLAEEQDTPFPRKQYRDKQKMSLFTKTIP